MTTITFDGNSISSDTQLTSEYKGYVRTKIIEGSDFILGWAGELNIAEQLIRNLKEGTTFKSLISDGFLFI